VLGTGGAGEFWPIIVMSGFLTGVYGAAAEIVLLFVFGAIALGTLVPILSDSGILPTPLGSAVLGTGVAGEFWPIIVMSGFLTGVYGAAAEIVLLFVFGAIDADVGASLIGAAMVSVLVYPLIATAISGPEEWSPDVVASTEAEY
jgi:hypothetical protein